MDFAKLKYKKRNQIQNQMALPKKYRLIKKNDFGRVYKEGRSFAEEFIVCKVLKNGLEFPRFGFVVGLKIAKKAVVRNKLRRRMQEIARLVLEKMKEKEKGVDVVVFPKKGAEIKKYEEIRQVFIKTLQKAGVIK